MLFQGSMVALVTPFKDGQIDEQALRNLIDIQIEKGTSVLVPCGTTGESATLTPEEHRQVIEITISQNKGRVKVLAGAGSNSTREAISFHKHCQEVGADGALHITPYYNKPMQKGLVAHFKALAESSDLPIVLYNVPGRTSVNMTVDTVVELSKIPQVVGIKEASGDLVQVSQIIRDTGPDFSVLSGEDALTFPMYALGANGAISVSCHVVPDLAAQLYGLCQQSDWDAARALHHKLHDLNDILFVETNPIPVKAALSLMGLIQEEYRLPLTPMHEASRQQLKEVLKSLDLIF